MTTDVSALIDNPELWNSLDWTSIRAKVRRLQLRIAKAVRKHRWGKVRFLQRILSRSLAAKLWAVKRVTTNKGRRTSGVDGVLWRTPHQKVKAVFGLQQRGYRALPLRRIYIPKKNGKKRPLSIPTMRDRAMQFLHKLTLAPVAETTADRNSYGFREGRCCHDAIQAAFNALSKPNSATWVLEGDIKGCFDNFNHQWMLDHVPMDKGILSKWLQAGYIENKRLYPNRKGTPQGGTISPTLSNMALDGLEAVVRKSVPNRVRVNFVRYADDFIVTGKSRQILEAYVKPAIEAFLSKRGLELSQEKTVITHITQGYTFLGQTFRKQGNILHITPSKNAIQSIIQKLGDLMRKHVASPAPALIKALNQTLRGWGNYHKHIVSSETFARIDTYVFEQLWRILRKRHPKKSVRWLIKKYWTASGQTSRFAVRHTTVDHCVKVYSVMRLHDLPRCRFVKIKADANPYLNEYASYFHKRRHSHTAKQRAIKSTKEYRNTSSILSDVKQPGHPPRIGLTNA
jgi:RNA-directed DNA polymerase